MTARLWRLFKRGDPPPGPARGAPPPAAGEQAQALVKQGHAAEERGDFEGAERLYRAAIVADPACADAHMNLGNSLNARGERSAAIACHERAVALDPQHASAHYNLGLALIDDGPAARVEQLFRTALGLRDKFPQAWFGLAVAQEAKGDPNGAMESYRKAVQLQPDYAEAHGGLGVLYKTHGQLSAAIDSFRKALAVRPDYAEVSGDLGNTLQEQGELDAAIDNYRKALALKPDHAGGYGNLLFTLNYHPDLSAEAIFDTYRDFERQFAAPLRAAWRAHPNNRDATRKLKVGYVSPDYCMHPVRHFLEPLLAHHDKQSFEVYAYSQTVKEDLVTERYKRLVDHWLPTRELSDEALAERIRADGIDILVDLAGHTAHNRLVAFARKPAPVSLSWLGFGYTTGVSAIDYLLTDGASAPDGSERLFAEAPWRLPTPGYVYRPAEGMGEVSELPATARGFVTFGTLTRSVRINHRTIRAWSGVLKRVPGSRLVVDSKNYLDAEMRDALAAKFGTLGIARDRLELGAHTPPWDVLRGIDIGLDCFPHNSGTTLFETLYMGIPFVTLAGRPSVGRLGSSILQGIGHAEWIADSEIEYIDKVVTLATDVPRLARLRSTLRAEMQASALMDEAGFARKVEVAYREMFARWAAGAPALT
jgi:protein O-GlcNAc transferase